MELKELTNTVCKKSGKKNYKVTNSFGVYDVYKLIRKNKWYKIGRPLKEHEFYAVIRGVNDILASKLAKGDTVVFPAKMGKLELRKSEVGASIVNGKLAVTYPIDWSETFKLWCSDSEAMTNKTLVRRNNTEVFRVRYNKYDADYNNQCYYGFSLNRAVKRALKTNIEKGKVDALW